MPEPVYVEIISNIDPEGLFALKPGQMRCLRCGKPYDAEHLAVTAKGKQCRKARRLIPYLIGQIVALPPKQAKGYIDRGLARSLETGQ